MAKRKIKSSGSVTVTDMDMDGLTMTDMRFWDKWCPEGTIAVSVNFYWHAGYYGDPDSFRAIVDWEIF